MKHYLGIQQSARNCCSKRGHQSWWSRRGRCGCSRGGAASNRNSNQIGIEMVNRNGSAKNHHSVTVKPDGNYNPQTERSHQSIDQPPRERDEKLKSMKKSIFLRAEKKKNQTSYRIQGKRRYENIKNPIESSKIFNFSGTRWYLVGIHDEPFDLEWDKNEEPRLRLGVLAKAGGISLFTRKTLGSGAEFSMRMGPTVKTRVRGALSRKSRFTPSVASCRGLSQPLFSL